MALERPRLPLWFSLTSYIHRENIVLAVLCAAAVAVFLVTRMAAAAAHDVRVRDARVWYERGLGHLAAGQADEAIEALGRARALDRSVRAYHLAFAQALSREGQPEAARQTLLGVRDDAPEDPDVNRELAELEASLGRPEQAVAFYQRALYGTWPAEQIDARRELRRQFIRYLLDQGMHARAVAQVLLLEDDVPGGSSASLESGELLLEARDPVRALAVFRAVLAGAPSSGRALAGAARAAFDAGDYAAARRYFARVPAGDAAFERQRRVAAAVLASDPLARGIGPREQARRIEAGAADLRRLIAGCRAAAAGAAHADLLTALYSRLPPGAPRAPASPRTPEDAVAALGHVAEAMPAACAGDALTVDVWRRIGAAHDEGR